MLTKLRMRRRVVFAGLILLLPLAWYVLAHTPLGYNCVREGDTLIAAWPDPLMRAIYFHDSVAVAAELNQGTDPNRTCPRYGGLQAEPAIILASQRGDANIVALLLQKGANVNAWNESHLTALDYATVNGNATLVALLKRHGGIIGPGKG